MTCPNHTSFRPLTVARRGTCGPKGKLTLPSTHVRVCVCTKFDVLSFNIHLGGGGEGDFFSQRYLPFDHYTIPMLVSVDYRTMSYRCSFQCGALCCPFGWSSRQAFVLHRTSQVVLQETWGFTSTETTKAYYGRGSWGAGIFISNTYSLHCHNQNASALRWAAV